MYYRQFGLDGPPFRFAPSAAVLYLGNSHRECLAALEWALLHDQCGGFMLLTGETGTGKTTLLNTVLARRVPSLHLACVTNPRLSFQEIMRVVLPQLGVTTDQRGKLELIQELERVVANQPAGHRTAIAIDEAQNLSDETLEDLRLLANRIDSQDQELRIVLMGHPELLEHLSAHHLRQLRERITTRVALTPLSPIESAGYIECRLGAQGGKLQIFEPKALWYLIKAAGGIPRRLNVLCHNALILACSKNASTVTLRIAREVVTDYECIFSPSGRKPRPASRRAASVIWPRRTLIRAAGACAAVAVIGLGSVSIPAIYNWTGLFNRAAAPVAGSAAHTSSEIVSESFASDAIPAAPSSHSASLAPAAAVPAPAPSPASADRPRRVSIQIHRGDTIHDLAAKYLGSADRTPDLIRANPQLKDPNVLYVGRTIYLPSTLNTISQE